MFNKFLNRLADNISDRVLKELKGEYSYREFLPPVALEKGGQILFTTKNGVIYLIKESSISGMYPIVTKVAEL